MYRLFTLIAIALFMLGGLNAVPSAMAGETPKAAHHGACMDACSSCAARCEKTLSYCHKKGGKHAATAHVSVIKDCITTCKTSADLMSRNSGLSAAACSLCKDACLKCAESCEEFKGDKTMKDCADECRKCAASCEKMAS